MSRPVDVALEAVAFEEQYTPEELGKRWKMHPSTIRRLFRDEAGVLKFTTQEGKRVRREYVTLRIPASVAARVYADRSR